MSANLVILASFSRSFKMSCLNPLLHVACQRADNHYPRVAFNFNVKPRRKLKMYLFQSAIARIAHVFLGSMYDILVEEAPLFIAI